jgi:hypothetical protein
VEFTGSFLDPGLDDDWWFRWDWGDGTVSDWKQIVKFSGGARVLLYHSIAGYEAEVLTTLQGLMGEFAVQFDEWNFIGTSFGGQGLMDFEDLCEYDVLIVPINTAPTVGWDDEYGDQLADYVDQGGGVVEMVASFYNGAPWGIPGRWADEDYSCFDPGYVGSSSSTTALYWSNDPGDPGERILDGIAGTVGNFGTTIPISTYGIRSDATLLADYNYYPAAAYKPEGTMAPGCGRIAGLNIFIPSGYRTGDAMMVTANAAWWASGQDPPEPLEMPIQLEYMGHTYKDDHPTTWTPEDIFGATLEVRDDDHEKTVTLGTPVQVHFQDWEDATHSNDWTKGWSEGGDGQWYLTYPYYCDGSWSAQRWYYPYGESTLTSPVFDFSTFGGAIIDWDQYWWANWGGGIQDGFVEMTTDGVNWDIIAEFHHNDPPDEISHQQAMYGQAAGESWVQLRFRIYMMNDWLWEVDNIEIGYANTYMMYGLGSASCDVTIQNVFPSIIVPSDFVDIVDEMVTIDFEGFSITDPALMERTEEFWYRWDYGDGTPVGDWIYKGTIAPPPLRLLLLNSWASESAACIQGITDELASRGFGDLLTIDEWNYYFDGSPSVSEMMNYDVILTSTNYYIYSSALLTELGNNLADACDAGVGVVQMTFAGGTYYSGFTGRWLAEDYTPIPYAGNYYGYLSLGDVYDSGHMIMENVADMQAYYSHATGGLTSGATRLADYANGNTLCAYFNEDEKTSGSGRIAGVNFFPWPSYISGDAMTMLGNSVLWAWGDEIPTEILDTVSHDYGDNGIYECCIQIIDDDMMWDNWYGSQPVFTGPGDEEDWISFNHFPVEVLNVDPDITPLHAEVNLDLVIRTTGEPHNDCTMTLWQGSTALGSVTVHHDGNYQMETMPATLDMGVINDYYVTVEYENADPDGANPTWVFEGRFSSGHIKELKNVFKEDGTIWTITADMLKQMLVGEDIIFTADGHDDGSDDLAFNWWFGDGEEGIHVYANVDSSMEDGVSAPPENIFDAHSGRDPWFDRSPNTVRSPDMNPIDIDDEISHAFAEDGYYYVCLILMDDDVCDGYPSYQSFLNGGGYDMEFITIDLS